MTRAIVTDIEGTTSSISFVKDVLFPYAHRHLPEFVATHAADPEVKRLLQAVAEECGSDLSDEQCVAVLLQWVAEDRKATPLKALQGLIWEAGYRRGDFQGHIYPDAVAKLQAWHALGMRLYVYSSGSVHAQKLLFAHTAYGDLTPLFAGYFDTRIGNKAEVSSYRAISEAVGLAPGEILFLSDIAAELDAARAAGLQTCQLLRPGAMASAVHPHAKDFNEVELA